MTAEIGALLKTSVPNSVDKLTEFINGFFDEINIYAFHNDRRIVVYDKNYFLDKENMTIKRNLWGCHVKYSIRF